MSTKRTLFAVLAVHISLLVWMMSSASFTPKPHKQHLTVRTLSTRPKEMRATLAKSTPAPTAAAPPAAQKITPPQAPEPKPAPKTASKPVTAAPSTKKKEAPAKPSATAAKKSSPTKNKSAPAASPVPGELLRQLEESIAKIDKKQDNLYAKREKKELNAVAAAPTLQVDSISSLSPAESEEASTQYQDGLISHLQRSLHLPDYGEVKIQLTLKEDGSVIKVVVVKAESSKNRNYLEKNLPLLRFPRLDGSLADRKQHTFIITFCNHV